MSKSSAPPNFPRPIADTIADDLDRYTPEVVKNLDPDHQTRIEPEKVTGRVVAMLAVLVLGALVAMLNETALSVALPAVMADFVVPASTAQWLTTGFMLTMAVVIPTTGFLLQRFTTRALFTAAMLIFLSGTIAAALAPSFGLLLVARVLQAMGTAIILPQLMATTLTAVPARYRGTVMGLNSVVISAAPALGPTMSGFIVDLLSWRWLFGVMIPIVVVVLIAGLVFIRTDGARRRIPFDLPSVLVSVFAFGGIVYALSSIGQILAGNWLPLVALAVGIVALVVFVRRQLMLQRVSGDALLDLAPFTLPIFRNSVMIVAIAMATMLGTVMVLPLHLQVAMGVSTLTTGLMLLPGGLIQGVISPLVGRVFDKRGARVLVIPGAILLAAGQIWMVTLSESSSKADVIIGHVIFSIGMAVVMTPLMTVSLGSLPPRLYGHGSAIMNTMQQLAGAAGSAILIASMSIGLSRSLDNGVADAIAQADGTRLAFVVGAVLALVAVGMSFTIRSLPVPAREHTPSGAEDRRNTTLVDADVQG